jgi:hypothetical protein
VGIAEGEKQLIDTLPAFMTCAEQNSEIISPPINHNLTSKYKFVRDGYANIKRGYALCIGRWCRSSSCKKVQSYKGLLFWAKATYNDNEAVRMKRPILLIALVVPVAILAKLLTWAVSDASTSLADGNIPHKGMTTSQTEASNSSARSATIITMT